MKVSCIVATAHNRVIGRDNDIPWYLPADLKYFKKVTTGHHILMGRKCYQSIGKPLSNRTNIIITRDPYFISSNCLIAHRIEEGLELALDNGADECFIIGGGMIYSQTIDFWDRIYLTKVDLSVPDGDVFFPEIEFSRWSLVSEENHLASDKNPHDYSFLIYDKA